MFTGFHRFFLLGLIVLAGFFLAACQSQQQPITPAVPGISVSIEGDTCPGIVVKAGDQVTWTNQDSREHNISHLPEAGGSLFSSGALQPNDSFTFTFTEPGTYTYSCSPDGSASGTVTVEP